ncbi:MAG: hypothetical protein RLZZ165_1701, partial [Bacteroidota bacterium]
MFKRLTGAQKRGLLAVLAGLLLLAGWRWRAARLASEGGAATVAEVDGRVRSTAPVRIELNGADTTLLQTIKGVGAASARRIVRYREIIGGFTSTDQLLKVWGITPENFIRIEEQVYVDTTTAAYASLRKAKEQGSPSPAEDRPSPGRESYSPYSHGYQSYTPRPPSSSSGMPTASPGNPGSPSRWKRSAPLVDINTADSASLVEVSGIGPVTARSIVRYRSLIFFFHSLGQLQEVWGVRPENLERMLPYLTVGDGFMAFPHLKINEMDAGQLGRH